MVQDLVHPQYGISVGGLFGFYFKLSKSPQFGKSSGEMSWLRCLSVTFQSASKGTAPNGGLPFDFSVNPPSS